MFPQRLCFPVPAFNSTCKTFTSDSLLLFLTEIIGSKDQVKGLNVQWHAR